MSTLIHRRVAQAREGTNPYVIRKVRSGWVVMGDVQFLPGYCLLLPDPVVPHLNALEGEARTQFLSDMITIGDAVLEVTGAVRINYEMLGNTEPALHAHLFPRRDDEPEALRPKPVWFYDWEQAPPFDPEQHGSLREQLRAALADRFGPEQPA
jgi:diadenosine tetraphosphate (Ap4A) HIT family hydrolase